MDFSRPNAQDEVLKALKTLCIAGYGVAHREDGHKRVQPSELPDHYSHDELEDALPPEGVSAEDWQSASLAARPVRGALRDAARAILHQSDQSDSDSDGDGPNSAGSSSSSISGSTSTGSD